MAVRSLYFLRHAHAPRAVQIPDKDRQLSSAGENEIKQLALSLATKYLPDIIISSDATRTRQTTERLCSLLGYEPKIIFTPLLYNCSPGDIANIVAKCEKQYKRLMIVGHNPSISDIVDHLNCLAKHQELATKARDYIHTTKLTILKSNLSDWSELYNCIWKIEEVFWPNH
jgi:phosphohistidine phosphatase